MAKSNVDPHNRIAKQWATNLSEKQLYLVQLTSEGKIELCGAGGEGYVLAEPGELTGEYTEGVRAYGTIVVGSERQKVIVGGTVAIGNQLESNSEGKAVKASNGLVVGVALEAGVAGDIVEMLTCVPVTTA
jgi:hypothetical protein